MVLIALEVMKSDKEKDRTDNNYRSEECISHIESAVKNRLRHRGGLNVQGVLRIVGLK